MKFRSPSTVLTRRILAPRRRWNISPREQRLILCSLLKKLFSGGGVPPKEMAGGQADIELDAPRLQGKCICGFCDFQTHLEVCGEKFPEPNNLDSALLEITAPYNTIRTGLQKITSVVC